MTTNIVSFLALFAPVMLLAQQTSHWQASLNPERVFIKNEGQFESPSNTAGTVLFVAESNGGQIFLTDKGVVYQLQKKEKQKIKNEEWKRKHMSHQEWEQLEHTPKVTTKNVEVQWVNANANVTVAGELPVSHYYNYTKGDKEYAGVKAYGKVVYKNLYPGIDVEYVFHPQVGIEYNFIVHPGGDAANIKMSYRGASGLNIDGSGNIHIPTPFGDIVDHAPLSFYSSKTDATVASDFVKKGKVVSFQLGNYDHAHELTIDPWTVTPAMPNSNRIFCVKADSSSNVYIYGGDSPFKLQKYNPAGVLQWTYTTPWDSANSWFGTLQVDKAGNSYVTSGSVADIIKVNTSGSLVWDGPNVPMSNDEYWGLAFNQDETQLVAGGTRMSGGSPLVAGYFGGIIYEIDINSGSQVDTVTVTDRITGIGAPFYPNEVRSICFSPNGNYYFLTLDTIGSINGSLDINYQAKSGNVFTYQGSTFSFTPQGQNLICANSNFIYTSRGDSIEKRDIVDGSILKRAEIQGGDTSLAFGALSICNAGIALDDCGNVYAGSQTGVCKFDANLNQVAFATTPDTVYAVAINNNGEVVASGRGFVVSLNLNACSPYLSPGLSVAVSPSNTTCAGVCNGKATTTVTYGTPPYTYAWSNGSNAQTATGLCVGAYQVTVTDNVGSSATASFSVGNTPFSIVDSVIHTTCGGASGVAGIMSTSGVPPYSFQWSTGSIASVVFGLSPGVYTVTITDSVGCVLADTFKVFGTGSPQISITATAATICANDSSQICAPAGYAGYNWNSGATTQCINVNQPGNYKVTVIDNGYCTATSQTIVVTVLPVPSVTAVLSGNLLNAQSPDQLVAYEWYRNGVAIQAATFNSYTATLQGNYSVLVTAVNGCKSMSQTVYYSPCSAYFVIFPDLNTPHNWYAINQATGAQPISYLWSWGDGATSTGAYPTHTYANAGYYDICLSITDSNGCSSTYCDSSVYLYKTDETITVNVVSELPNEVIEAGEGAGLLIFPNPAGDALNISFRGEQIERVRIYNAAGSLVADMAKPGDNRIDIHALLPGVYVAEIQVLGLTARLQWTKL